MRLEVENNFLFKSLWVMLMKRLQKMSLWVMLMKRLQKRGENGLPVS